MDPVTHAMVGLAVSKATGNSIEITNAATMAITIGSLFPDADILLQRWGDYFYLKHHRSQTHSIIGMLVCSGLISAILGLVYQNTSFFHLYLFSLLGCASHVFFDLFNIYGAKLLWPISKKKFTFNLMSSFDFIFLLLLGGFLIGMGKLQMAFSISLIIYLIARVIMKVSVILHLKSRYKADFKKVSVMPGMTNVLKWHFILESEWENIVGQKGVLKKNISIINKFDKLQDKALKSVLHSKTGAFFKEFSPLFHVKCERIEEFKRYTFVDMRYFLRNKFMHHAIVEMNPKGEIIKETFNPYSINREVLLPIKKSV